MTEEGGKRPQKRSKDSAAIQLACREILNTILASTKWHKDLAQTLSNWLLTRQKRRSSKPFIFIIFYFFAFFPNC